MAKNIGLGGNGKWLKYIIQASESNWRDLDNTFNTFTIVVEYAMRGNQLKFLQSILDERKNFIDNPNVEGRLTEYKYSQTIQLAYGFAPAAQYLAKLMGRIGSVDMFDIFMQYFDTYRDSSIDTLDWKERMQLRIVYETAKTASNNAGDNGYQGNRFNQDFLDEINLHTFYMYDPEEKARKVYLRVLLLFLFTILYNYSSAG